VISAIGHETDYTISDFVADLRAPTPSAAAELVIGRKAEMIARLESWTARLQQAALAHLERWRGRVRELVRGLLDPTREIELNFQRLDELDRQLKRSMIRIFNRVLTRWESFDHRLFFSSPRVQIDKQQRDLNQRSERLSQRMEVRIKLQYKMLEKWIGKLDALSPLAILGRGYSIARRLPKMTLIKEAGEMRHGDMVHLTLHRGALISRVEEVK
jgi:exodeoxyribonuclease VII large subunit